MIKKKFLMICSVSALLLIVALIFIFVRGRALEKDTCKKIVESSLSVLLKRIDNNRIPLISDWRKLNSEERNYMLQNVEENTYSECEDFPYLVTGKESDGSELNIYVRQITPNDNIEVLLGKRE